MDGDMVAFVPWDPFDGGGKFVDGVGQNVGQTSDESCDENVGHGRLLLGSTGI